jgi:alpha-1,6-mannosyltransferase
LSLTEVVKKLRPDFVFSSYRRYGLMMALGYTVLIWVHWRNSWDYVSQGYPFPDLGGSRKAIPYLEVCQTMALCGLYGLYLTPLIYWDRWKFRAREIIAIGVPVGLLALAALPANSTDILGYIGFGRLAGVHGANPYLHTYSEFADFFYPLVEWDITMPYGPALLPILMLAGWVSQHIVLGAVFTLKAIWLGVHVANCALIYKILRSWRMDPTFGLFLYGLNPLALLELVANGHNDGLLIFFGLASIYAIQSRWFGAALWLSLLAALVKLPGAFIFLSVVIYLIWRRKWRGLIYGSLGGVALLLPLKVTLFPTTASLLSLTNVGSYTQNSFHHLFIRLAHEITRHFGIAIGHETIFRIDRRLFTSLLGGFCLWRWWKLRNLNGLIRELAYIFAALLIGQAAWFFPWYVTWLIPLAALIDSAQLRWAIIAYAWSSLAIYAFPYFVVAEAPMHELWSAIRISIAHAPPLVLLTRAFWADAHRAQMKVAGATSGEDSTNWKL